MPSTAGDHQHWGQRLFWLASVSFVLVAKSFDYHVCLPIRVLRRSQFFPFPKVLGEWKVVLPTYRAEGHSEVCRKWRKECETLIEVNSTEQREMRWIALKRESYWFEVKENRNKRTMPYFGFHWIGTKSVKNRTAWLHNDGKNLGKGGSQRLEKWIQLQWPVSGHSGRLTQALECVCPWVCTHTSKT